MSETSDGQESSPASETALEGDTAEVAFSIQGLVDGIDWSPHEDALGRWKQTHLIADVPLTWLAPFGEDPLTRLDSGLAQPDGADTDTAASNSAEPGEPGGHGDTQAPDWDDPCPDASDPDVGPVWVADTFDAIICSQTCDLGATPPGTNHFTALAAPLVHEDQLGSGKRRNDAAKGLLSHLVRVLPADPARRDAAMEAARDAQREQVARRLEAEDLTEAQVNALPPLTLKDIPKGHRWYADLRVLVPLSKGLLLNRDPVEGFLIEDESLAFGETLAQKFRRPALHEALSEDLPAALEEFVQHAGASKQAFLKVEQIRLSILDGDRLNPVRGQLLVLTEGGKLSEAEQGAWEDLNKHAYQVFAQHNISYVPLLHWDVTEMPAAVYRRTVPVRCRHIGHTRWP